MSLDLVSDCFAGRLLAAMPAIQDPTFSGALVLVCAHSPDGAMGLIVNRLASPPEVERASDGPSSVVQVLGRRMPIQSGGPAEGARPFLLHAAGWTDGDATHSIDEDHALTATPGALARVAAGDGPDRTIVALGYAGWGPGQLESEVGANVWLTTRADPEITFSTDNDAKWAMAVRSIGAVPEALSGAVGHA